MSAKRIKAVRGNVIKGRLREMSVEFQEFAKAYYARIGLPTPDYVHINLTLMKESVDKPGLREQLKRVIDDIEREVKPTSSIIIP